MAVLATHLVRQEDRRSRGSAVAGSMPPENRLRLHDKDGLAPRWQQGRAEEKSKSISWTHTRPG
jgi:hypothetical protein